MSADEMLAAIVIACIVRYRLDRRPTFVIVDRAALADGTHWPIAATCAHALLRSMTRPVRQVGHLRTYRYHVLAIDRAGTVSDVPDCRRYVVDGSAQSFVVACMWVTGRALGHAMVWWD